MPNHKDQKRITDSIYAIKKGEMANSFIEVSNVVQNLRNQNAKTILLGCTELSLLYPKLQDKNFNLVDPLHILANRLVQMATRVTDQSIGGQARSGDFNFCEKPQFLVS